MAQIISEGSVGSGIRRIEMLTGREATAWLTGQLDTLQAVASKLGIPAAQAPERLDALLAELKQRQHELDALQGKLMRGELEAVLAHAQPHDGITLLVTQVAAPDVARMREMGDWLRDKLGSTVIVLGSVIDDKPQLLTMITPDLVQQGYHAGNLVRELARSSVVVAVVAPTWPKRAGAMRANWKRHWPKFRSCLRHSVGNAVTQWMRSQEICKGAEKQL